VKDIRDSLDLDLSSSRSWVTMEYYLGVAEVVAMPDLEGNRTVLSNVHLSNCTCQRLPLSLVAHYLSSWSHVKYSAVHAEKASPTAVPALHVFRVLYTQKKPVEMADYDDIAHGSELPAGSDMPPPDAEGLDRPDEMEDALDDTANEFNNDVADDADKLDDDDDADDESLLSDVDEAVLDNFDENKLEIAPDFEQLRSTKIKKRKRDEGDEGRPKKKERTREKTRRRRGASEGAEGAEGDLGRRRRGGGGGGGGERKPRERVEIDEDTLPPEERRRRALDRAMDAAVKKSSGIRKRKGEIVSMATPCTKQQILTNPGPRTSCRRRTQRPPQ